MEILGPVRLPLEIRDGKVVDFQLYFAKGSTTRYLVAAQGLDPAARPLVRIESACLFGHVFRSRRCDCGFQLQEACDRIGRDGGLVVYGIDEDGRGLGIEGHFRTYMLRQLQHMDTTEVYRHLGVPLDQRDYTDIAQILSHFSLTDVRILTNNPRRLDFLERAGIRYERVPHERHVDRYSAVSMLDKASALPYMFSFDGHMTRLRRLSALAQQGSVGGMLLDDFHDERAWSLPLDADATRFAALVARAQEGSVQRYRILYLDQAPPTPWLAAAAPHSFDLLVLPRQEPAGTQDIAALRALGWVVDTVDLGGRP